jgi:Domain of unknown function (DUF1877)
MSMMGCFRELPASLLGRLQDDPSLVDDVVLAKATRSRMPAEIQEHMAGAIEQMKASIADMGPQLLPMMPEEQRKVPSALDAAKVYPGGWEDPANLEWLLESFDEVRAFYREATGRGSAALLFLT